MGLAVYEGEDGVVAGGNNCSTAVITARSTAGQPLLYGVNLSTGRQVGGRMSWIGCVWDARGRGSFVYMHTRGPAHLVLDASRKGSWKPAPYRVQLPDILKAPLLYACLHTRCSSTP